jgi:hypothetical protein
MLVTGSTAQIAENSETMVETCPFDESLESLDPYDQTLESDDNEDRLRTVTQDEEDQPSPVASHMTVVELDAMASKPKAKLPTEAGVEQCQTRGLMLDAMASKPKAKLPTVMRAEQCQTRGLMLDAMASTPKVTLPMAMGAEQCQTRGLTLDAMASKPKAKLPTGMVAGKASPIAITFSDAPSGNAMPGTLSHRICQILPKTGGTQNWKEPHQTLFWGLAEWKVTVAQSHSKLHSWFPCQEEDQVQRTQQRHRYIRSRQTYNYQ